MISRESFASIEGQLRDRYRYMQWALASFGVAGTLLIDRGLELCLQQNMEHATIVITFAVPFALFGLLLSWFYFGKQQEYKIDKDKLFDRSNIIKDETVITAADGSTTIIDHLAEEGSQDSERGKQ